MTSSYENRVRGEGDGFAFAETRKEHVADTHPLRETFTPEEWRQLSRDVQLCRISWPVGIVKSGSVEDVIDNTGEYLMSEYDELKAMTDRLCRLMDWEPGTSHKFEIIRQTCSGKAAALSVEKGNEIADKLEELMKALCDHATGTKGDETIPRTAEAPRY